MFRLTAAILLGSALTLLSACGDVYVVEPGAEKPATKPGDAVLSFPHLDAEARAATDDEVRNLTNVRVYLECGDLATTTAAVRKMTIFQVAQPAAAVGDHTMNLPDRCRAGTVRAGGYVLGYSTVQSKDGGWVEIIGYRQPNGYIITFARAVTKWYGTGTQLWF